MNTSSSVVRGSFALVAALTLLAACTRAETPPTATTSAPLAQAEAAAWAMVRSSHPGVPVIIPTWLPPAIDRERVEVRGIGFGPAGPTEPVYTVAYAAPSGATILFALGPASDIAGSSVGIWVRNSPAVLSFATVLFTEPTRPETRRVRWQEGRYVLRIESDRFTGEDLLHVAWSLDPSGAPAAKYPYTRVKSGSCSAPGAVPEETVRRLLSFVGTGDRDSAADCFSLDHLGEFPSPGGWADLPRASDVKVSPPRAVAGRFVVGAGWLFATQPEGPWSQQPHMFFTLGLEDGRWRIYELATAPMGPPP